MFRSPILPRPARRLALLAALLVGSALSAQEEITVPGIPGSPEEFVALRDQMATSPEGGAAVYLTALLAFSENEELGRQFLTIALDQSQLEKSGKPGNYKGFKPARSLEYHLGRLKERPHLPRSYVAGTAPDSNYETSAPYRFVFTRNRFSEMKPDRIKVFVACSGAASPRPITLQRNNKGIWKVYESSSLYVDVVKGGQTNDEL